MSTVTVRMHCGQVYEIQQTPSGAAELVEDFADAWYGREVRMPEFNRADGTAVLINPAYVEAVETS